MNVFLATLKNGTLQIWRDKSAIIMLVIFPIVLIFVLGNALEAFVNPSSSLPEARLGLVMQDQGIAGQMLEEFLSGEEVSSYIEVSLMTEEEALAALEADALDSVLLARSGYTLSFISGERGMLELLRRGNSTAASIISLFVDGYQQIAAAGVTRGVQGSLNLDREALERDMLQKLPLKGNAPRAMDYYAITMTVMILLYTGMSTLGLADEFLFSSRGSRIAQSPASKGPLLGGILLSGICAALLQGVTVVVFSGLVFGANWGENPLLVLGVIFAMALFAQGLSLFLIAVSGSQRFASSISYGLIWIVTFVSGGYMPMSFGETMDSIFHYTPNSLAQSILFGSIYGGNEGRIGWYFALLLLMGSALLALSILFLRRKKA